MGELGPPTGKGPATAGKGWVGGAGGGQSLEVRDVGVTLVSVIYRRE